MTAGIGPVYRDASVAPPASVEERGDGSRDWPRPAKRLSGAPGCGC